MDIISCLSFNAVSITKKIGRAAENHCGKLDYVPNMGNGQYVSAILVVLGELAL